jgi:hypothetical protein
VKRLIADFFFPSYYIKSASDPTLYWFVPGNEPNYQGDVYGSRKDRTRFRITLSNNDLPKGTPIIGTDDVYISLVSGDNYVAVEPSGKLVIGTNPVPYKFIEFQRGFIAKGLVVRDEQSVENIYKTDDGSGKRWELV